MNEFDYCKSKLWDSKLTWYTNTPDLTECFKKTVLVLMPCGFLWIFLPLEVYFLRKSETRDIPFNYLNVIKLILAFLGVCLTFADFVHDVSILGFQVIIDLYYSPIILCLTRILFFILTITNIKRGIRSSGILFTYSFLSVICGLPEIYTIIKNEFPIFLRNDKEVENLSYILYYITLTLVLILNCFADEIPQRSLCLISKNTYPYKDVSFLSKLFMTWFDTYVWKNHQNPVKHILWDLDSEDMAENIATREVMHRIKKYKDKKIKREEFSILKALFEEYGSTFWLCVLIRTTFEIMTVGLYITTDWLISGLELKEETWKEYMCVSFYFIIITSQTLVWNKYWEICYRLNVKVRTLTMSYLYKKALLISNAVRMEYTTSDIVNLISLDTFQLQSSIEQFHFLFALCAQVLAAYIYLYFLLGPSAMISMVFIIFIFIVNYRTISKMKRLQQEEMKNKDKRGKFMQEIFSGIKVLKMYAWEPSFKKVAMYLRSEENKTLKKIANVNIILHTIFQNFPFWATMVTYLCYAFATHEEMDVRITFVTLVLFNSLRVAFHHIPATILYVQQVLVSIKRMNKFLNSEELDEHSISHESTDERLIMQNATFSWISKNGPNSLENLNIKINESKLVGIVGPVGSGKSSLISAFLGEMYKISGYVNTKGSIAYVPQQAWILNTTVKENITLGEQVDKELYEKAIQSCALRTDLQAFSAGDLTEIGEKGINLSGGQKQRISLARAVCRSADIYFFDDPLSAVDTHVANHIFNNVLGSNGILKEKVRILVTHNTKFFPLMDEIIVLKNGCISEIGTYQQLTDEGGEFSKFLNSIHKCNEEKKEEPNDNNDKVGSNEDEPVKTNNHLPSRFEHKQKSLHKIIQEEETKIKRIDKKTYWMYIKAGGVYMWLVVSISFLLFQISTIMSNIWLSKWINSVDNYLNRYFYLSIYTGFGIMQFALTAIGLVIFYRSSVKAAQYFYQRLLDCVIQWPMSSFDATPIGRIIKRFSDDIYMIDNHIAVRWGAFFMAFSRYFATVIFLSVYVPMSTFTTIPLIISLYILREYYASFHHQLKRIETKEKSPLYSHLVETISGIQSIRAFCFQNKFIHRCYKKIDSYSAAYHASITCERWFCSRVELLESLFLCSISTFLIFEQDRFDIGMMSVIIVFGMQVIRGIAYLFSVFSGVEDGIISLEQINEYLTYPEEPFSRKSSVEISKMWPPSGEVIFDNVKLRYRDGLDFVLDGLSFTIQSKEKIGIVGRTGAGKSSIIVALFRLVELAEGKILIDGVDISKVNVHELRSKIAVIPQDPILFSGTLRFNLDPFNEYQDDLLWDILEKSHLKTFVSSLPAQLLYGVEEGGQNLSFGQRQLICLARALVRKSKILVLDEATASVDLRTDELIQSTIRQEFSNSTVITIAHRLNTLQGYDKILMLEGGRIVKFDKPEKLLH